MALKATSTPSGASRKRCRTPSFVQACRQTQRPLLTTAQRGFLAAYRVGHLATADAGGQPHVIPVCFVVIDENAYVTIDDKPKRRDRPLKRLRNIVENPRAAMVVDRYDEDWSRLAWVMLRGRAYVLDAGAEHDLAQEALRSRYPQMRSMHLEQQPVIALRVDRVASWGALE